MMTSRLVRSVIRWVANMCGLVIVAAFYNPTWDPRRVWAVVFIGLWFTVVEMSVLFAKAQAEARLHPQVEPPRIDPPKVDGRARPMATLAVFAILGVTCVAIQRAAYSIWRPVKIEWTDDAGMAHQMDRRPMEPPDEHLRRALSEATEGK